ncbi:unnamed protein product [Nyctereutes procyonoides]|uniref:(raccoon dog) hypothetical protein n=1 Tax=Nyctereutes procyonoides TaxID=34880 RepID=A0A811Z3H9_NYCPR|nr:unnamed protein product [Nyctereutes procyonoides]
MKVRKSSTPEEVKKRSRSQYFSEAKEILVGDVGQTVHDPHATFVKMPPDKDCHYALYDTTYETKESKKEDLVFTFWAPESAPLKSKMIYVSSKDATKKKLTGIKHELQANCYKEVKKLGGSAVISLEGKPVRAPSSPLPGVSGSSRPTHGGCRLPPSSQTGEAGGDPSRGKAIPSPQLPDSPLTPWTFLLPVSLTVLAFPNRF